MTWREENEKSFGIYIRGNGSCKSTENHHTWVSLKPFGTSYTFTYWRSRKLRKSHDKEVCAFFIANVLKLEPGWKASDRLMIKDVSTERNTVSQYRINSSVPMLSLYSVYYVTSLIDVGIIIHYIIIDYNTIRNMFVQLIITNQYMLHVHVLSPCIIVNQESTKMFMQFDVWSVNYHDV